VPHALAAAILDALRPRGARERVRFVVTGGLTAAQVHERLPEEIRAEIAGSSRQPVDRVWRALRELVATGQVRSRTNRWSMPLNTKGMRDMVVDTYRLR
jgi:hypothetical protein